MGIAIIYIILFFLILCTQLYEWGYRNGQKKMNNKYYRKACIYRKIALGMYSDMRHEKAQQAWEISFGYLERAIKNNLQNKNK